MTLSSPVRLGIIALALLASACTGESNVESEAPTTTTTEASDTTTTTEPAEPDTTPTTTTEAPRPTPPESMPGDLIQFGPTEGDILAVVGVAFDDVLNVRIAPGTQYEIVGMLDPDEDSVTANGMNRLLESSFWVEIETEDGPGWVNEAFVGFLGVSQTLESDLASATAEAEKLGAMVAETYASEEPPSRITLVATEGDTVTYDVLGIGDDAAKGFRLEILTSSSGDGRKVESVVETTICSRGLDPQLRCV